ncbi:MAG: ATP-binding protein [Patescibacteria group bacterium]
MQAANGNDKTVGSSAIRSSKMTLEQLRQRIFFYLCSLGVLIMLVATPLQIVHDGDPVFIVQDFVVLGSAAFILIFGRRARNLIWYMRWIAAILTSSFVINVITGTTNGLGIYWTFLYPMVIFILFASREALVWSVTYLAFVIGLAVTSMKHPVLDHYSAAELWTSAAVLTILTCINYFRQRFTEQGRDSLLQAEEVLERQEAALRMFKQAADSAYDHIVITDPEGIVLYANAAATRITGYTQKEILGTKAGKLWSMPMPHNFYEELWRTIKTQKQIFTGELQNRRKNGEEYDASASISPIVNAEGGIQYFLGIERDITREKQIDRAKTEFVTLASHQLRTPLSAVNWYIEALLHGDGGKLSTTQKQYLQEVYAGSTRMVKLVQVLLNVSRIDMGTFAIQPVPTKIQELAQAALQDLAPRIREKKLQVKKIIATNIPKLPLDPELTLIILQNLLTNAVKYTPAKGTVTLRITRDARVLTITVQDTGYGIEKKDYGRIFQKLFRASNIRSKVPEGTGLGLYMVKAILESSGGGISFTSKLGKGTTFRATLPATGMRAKEGTKALNA